MKKVQGFTLIEILVALTIFAIIASITSSTLYYAFNTRQRVNEQSERLGELQIAISLFAQDTRQIVERAIRGDEMQMYPIFSGQNDYLEFTRGGFSNPDSAKKRSHLTRIAYVCEGNALKRKTWATLDPVKRAQVESSQILLKNLKTCQFEYLNQTLQVFSEWRTDAVNQNQIREPLPQAIKLNFSVQHSDELNLLFPLAGALYGPR